MSILGYPIQELFLYFMLYSFLGWILETCYCSLREHRLVDRGFLYGPLCPIYGAGVLLMILFFSPIKGNLLLFYLTAVLVMTSWEYFVAWLLETTTHVRYWDYSNRRFHIKGRVCLSIALIWGVLSFLVIFWLHPLVTRLYHSIPMWLINPVCIIALAVLLIDAALTIHHLALVSNLLVKLSSLLDETQLQISLGKAELEQRLSAQTAAGRARYNQLIARLEQYTRGFRRKYTNMHLSNPYSKLADDLKDRAFGVHREHIQKRSEKKQNKEQSTGKK